MAAIDTPARGTQLYLRIAFAIGIAAAVLEVLYLLGSPLPFDPAGYLVGRDFVNTWMGAKLAAAGDPSPWFDHAAYNALLQASIRPDFPEHAWSYPPHVLLFTWPLHWLPYVPAYLLWTTLGLIVFVAVSADGERRPDRLLLLAVAPAVIVNIFCGQNGLFLAALMIGGLINLDRRPVLSGILFGILTVKPQLGLLVPVLLLVTGRWRVIAAAAATTVILVGLTAAIFGVDVWLRYIAVVLPVEAQWMSHGTGLFMMLMPTVFMNARTLGLPLEAAYAAQAVVSLAAVAGVIWTFRRWRDPLLSQALFVTASLLVSYHAGLYDLAVLGWVLGKLIDRPDNRPLDLALMLAVWALPMSLFLLGVAFIPGSVVLAAFAARQVWRLAQARAARPAPQAAGLPVLP